MSNAWFQNQIAPDGVTADGCHPDEARALQLYINNRINLQDTAYAITRPLVSDEDPDRGDQPLWVLIQDALLEFCPTYIPDLISLLQAIDGLLERELGPKNPKSTSTDCESTWKGLPISGHLWADIYRQDCWRENLATELSELRAAHIRQANVAARLSAPNVKLLPLDWAYETITNALETNAPILDFEIPAVIEWIDIVGKELYRGAKEGEESWALCRKRLNGTREKRMSLKRWESWLEKIREHQQQSDIAEITKRLSAEMGKLEH